LRLNRNNLHIFFARVCSFERDDTLQYRNALESLDVLLLWRLPLLARIMKNLIAQRFAFSLRRGARQNPPSNFHLIGNGSGFWNNPGHQQGVRCKALRSAD
jgi:hypothetical protein